MHMIDTLMGCLGVFTCVHDVQTLMGWIGSLTGAHGRHTDGLA